MQTLKFRLQNYVQCVVPNEVKRVPLRHKIHSSPQATSKWRQKTDLPKKNYFPYFSIRSIQNEWWIANGKNGAHDGFVIWLLFHLLSLRFSQHRNLFNLIYNNMYAMLPLPWNLLVFSDYGTAAYYFFFWMVRIEWKDRQSKTERDAQNWFLQRKKTG